MGQSVYLNISKLDFLIVNSFVLSFLRYLRRLCFSAYILL